MSKRPSPLSPDLIAWGATYEPAAVKPGQPYWQLVEAAGPMEIGGNHHLYVDVWDEHGNRIVDVPVLFYWFDTERHTDRKETEPKPGDTFAVDLPMYAGGNAYGATVDDGLPSDAIFGMGLGKFVKHHGFRLIFQRKIADGVTMPEPPAEPPVKPPTKTPLTARDVIALTREYLDVLEATL